MNRGNAFVLVVGFSVMAACGSTHIDMSSNIVIQGSVARASDQSPVNEAQIVMIDESLDDAAITKGEFVRESVSSDANGRFKIDYFLFWGKTVRRGGDPAIGTLRVEIHKGGYSSARYSVQLSDFAYNENTDRSVLDLGIVLLSEEP